MFTVKIMTSGAAFRDNSSGQVDQVGTTHLIPLRVKSADC